MSAENQRAVWAWAFYDWANSAFATVVLAGFFPILFHDYWSQGLPPAEITARLGAANSLASLLVAVSAPVLGAIADRAGAKRRFLGLFMILGVVMTGGLNWVDGGDWLAAATLYVVATVGFMGANIFYDALLVSVAREERWHFVSGLGFGLGYLGGGVLYAGCVFAALNPAVFGFADAGEAARFAFLATAVWWLVFALPLFFLVPEPAARDRLRWGLVPAGFREVAGTLKKIRQYRMVALFLLAYWFYIDGVDTVITMAVAYAKSLGFETKDLILALLLVQFIGFPAAIVYGKLGQRFGARKGLYFGLAVYVVICVWGTQIRSPQEFYLIAVLVGLVQGGVQALSRSYYARLIPPRDAGEFFGFYNLLGKSASLIGPLLFGGFGLAFGDARYSMLSLIILFVLGGWLLSRVRVEEASAQSR